MCICFRNSAGLTQWEVKFVKLGIENISGQEAQLKERSWLGQESINACAKSHVRFICASVRDSA